MRTGTTSKEWRRAIRECADPERVEAFLQRADDAAFQESLAGAGAEQARIFCALFAGSRYLSEALARHADWVPEFLDVEYLKRARRRQNITQTTQRLAKAAKKTGDYALALSELKALKLKEMLRVGLRDLAGLASLEELLKEISLIADACLETVYDLCLHRLERRLGKPYHLNPSGKWQATRMCVLGMGKLGGEELNYSSDVDVLFVYDEEGRVFKSPPKSKNAGANNQTSHEFFNRLAEDFASEVSRATRQECLFRIDLRLRPEGNAGPVARSLESYENYYAQWGQTWERMMLIKARRVAGDAAVAGEFLETIHSFRYPGMVGERILKEVSAMKARIEKEVVRSGELKRNVKLGPGGIRDIEFVAQTLQLLHGGRSPFLQGSQTLPALNKFEQYKLLKPGEVQALSEAYRFLRNVEHRLQMEDNRQTHTIPNDALARKRLAALMGFASMKEFDRALAGHREAAREIYDRILRPKESSKEILPRNIKESPGEWRQILADHGFQDPAQALGLIKTFVHGPGYVHISPHTVDRAHQLLPSLLAICPTPKNLQAPPEKEAGILSDPDRVLARLDGYVERYGARSMLYEAFINNPSFFKLLLLLFDRSEYLSEITLHNPDIIDEIQLSGQLRRLKSKEATLKELRFGKEDKDQGRWIRRYQRTELIRIGLRDILGIASLEEIQNEIDALANACLEYALEVVMRERRMPKPPFAVIGLGKLGGGEMTYGSDLDIVFVAKPKASITARLQDAAKDMIRLLAEKKEGAAAYEVDTRLRPDGEQGPLVNSLDGYEDYFRGRARLWEIQTLSRASFLMGDADTGGAFVELARKLANFKHVSRPLACYSKDWPREIHAMRMRIEKERTPAGKDALAIKTGRGGLVDAEFIAQFFCLREGHYEPNTLKALAWIQESKLLPARKANSLIEAYLQLRRIERILRRWSFEGEHILPSEPKAMKRVAIRCGFADADKFMQTLNATRAIIRKVYEIAFKDAAR